jgi:succinate-acetate transporter protein
MMANVTRFADRVAERATWTKGGPVVSHLPDDEITTLEEQAQATIGDPTSLGLWGFATGTWMVGTVIAGVFPDGAILGTAPVLLMFAGIAQFIAGLFAFRRANSLAATAFCCFGAFNTTVGFGLLMQGAAVLARNPDALVLEGFLLESFGFIALALAIAALRTNWALFTVLLTLAIGYACSGVPDLANAVNQGGYGVVGHIGGWILVFSALCAYYTGMALVVNSTWKRNVLPIGGQP